MTWQCYTDKMSLRELAGIRGVAPSVRFSYTPNHSSINDFIYHVPANEKLYLWGVELFSNDYDCIDIYHIDQNGFETKIKNGGFRGSDFHDKLYFEYQNESFLIYEHPGFDDFWKDPYLLAQDGNNILKSNFFRCFSFANEGMYKVVLNEVYNPDYLDSSFAPINYDSAEYFNGSFLIYGNIKTDYNLDISDAGLRRHVYVKVISRDKDIIKEKQLDRRVRQISPGFIDVYQMSEYEDAVIDVFNEFVSFSILGARSYFIKNKFINGGFSLFDASSASLSYESLIDFEEDYSPVYTSSLDVSSFNAGNRYLYCRNLVIENCIFSHNIHADGSLLFLPQNLLGEEIRNANSGRGPVYDLRGSVFKNCHFINDSQNMLSSSNLDGCIFDGCTFENCSFNNIRSSGMVFRNCKWIGMSYSHLQEEFGIICGESNCVMGCSFENTGRVFSFKSWQPIYNNIFIKNNSYGTDRLNAGGEIFTAQSLNVNQSVNMNSGFHNNINIMNSYTKSNGSFLGIKNVNSKLNLSCFNYADTISYDYIYADAESSDVYESRYNVCLHNGCTSGGGVYMSGYANDNRWIDVVWGNPSFKESIYNFKRSELQYQPAPFFEVLSQDEQIPSRNLISNCVIVNYQEYVNFYGNIRFSDSTILREKNFKNMNVDNDFSELNNNSNLIFNLRKIVRQYY